MEMANCLRCKKLFPKFSDPICEDCKKSEEELFKLVKEWLDENPKSTVLTISQETGAPAKKIMQWLREGRLELVESDELKCRGCGIGISTGTYCDLCLAEVKKQVDEAFGDRRPAGKQQGRQSGVTMHTRDKRQQQ